MASKNKKRPLFDPKHPQYDAELKFVRWPYYRPVEVAQIIGFGVDKVRDWFKPDPRVIKVESQAIRPYRKNYTSLVIPFEVISDFLRSKSPIV